MKKITTILLSVFSALTLTASANPADANLFGQVFGPFEGDEFAIIGNNCRFVSSENGNQSITCNRVNLGAWERFTAGFNFPQNSQSVFAIKANNGRYLAVQSDGTVRATSTNPLANASRFISQFDSPTGFTALRSVSTGRFLSSENGGRTLRANRSAIGSWERFGIELLSSTGIIAN